MARPQIPENKRMGTEELLALPVVMDLQTAGRAFGLGRTITYELMRRGEFPCPVLRLGRSYRVLKADVMRMVGVSPESAVAQAEAPEDPAAAAPPPSAPVRALPPGGTPVVLVMHAVLFPEGVLEVRR
jgi:predicted DNA-binding transcriptional regulator AlpA